MIFKILKSPICPYFILGLMVALFLSGLLPSRHLDGLRGEINNLRGQAIHIDGLIVGNIKKRDALEEKVAESYARIAALQERVYVPPKTPSEATERLCGGGTGPCGRVLTDSYLAVLCKGRDLNSFP